MVSTVDVVEFEIGNEFYAMDIQLAQEIVEMVPITPLPKTPEFIAGVINLRGEMTTIITIDDILGNKRKSEGANKKIIILVPESANGSNVGIIVDSVYSVIQVPEKDIEHLEGGISKEAGQYIKGIIKANLESMENIDDNNKKGLIIWIDIEKIIKELIAQ